MITITNLYFTYSKRDKLFENLNLTLSAGYMYGVLGKNGTGKTTLLSLISGLLFPVEGKMEVMGKNPVKRQVDFLQELFLVSEEFDLPDVSPVKYAALYSSFYPHFDEEQYRYYLREFEIQPCRAMNKMSMGQRKKAYIARLFLTKVWMLFPKNFPLQRIIIQKPPVDGFMKRQAPWAGKELH
jgi:ABC-2 type transport system ATP-binding protein